MILERTRSKNPSFFSSDTTKGAEEPRDDEEAEEEGEESLVVPVDGEEFGGIEIGELGEGAPLTKHK